MKVPTRSVQLPDELVDQIDRLAAADSRTRSGWIRRQLERAVEREASGAGAS